jgi:hypothetical protein
MANIDNCDGLKVAGGADVNSCSAFTSELVEQGNVDTTADVQGTNSMSQTAQVTQS